MAGKLSIVFLLAFGLTALGCPLLIKKLRSLRFGQQIREDGPASHGAKSGTPTMGGAVFIPAAILALLVTAKAAAFLLGAILVTAGCALIGFIDDYSKLALRQSLGLKARSKLLGQVLITLLLIFILVNSGLYSTAVMIPIFGVTLDLGPLYPVLLFLLILGFSNSVNLTDGIDGLAAGAASIAFIPFVVIALRSGSPEAALFSAALIGACLGFLLYNRHPARLFMGDTGSLGLGGALAATAVFLKAELFLVIIGGLFFIEALSVMGQVASFQLTGRRILLMSPLHHHFELKGWSEWKVVLVFWAAAAILALVGLLDYLRLGPAG